MSGIPLTPNVFAFIQARTTSTRLPNKVLRSFVNEKSILHLIIERVQRVLPKKKIALLVPKGDLPLLQFAKQNQIFVFEGSEHNVRERFIQAAEYWNVDWILRLTGDNPFIDIEHLQYLIETIRFTKFDLLSFENLPIGMGGETFRVSAIKKNPSNGILPEHEEHVSLHIKQYPNEFSVLKLKPLFQTSLDLSKIRLTIDEEKDFLTCKEIYEQFQENNFGVNDILALYEKKPTLFKKNQNVQQVYFTIPKTEHKKSKKILIVYAPIQTHGTGHFRRMRLLKIYLESLNFHVDMYDLSSNLNDCEYDLCILDARDAQLPLQANFDKWIKIDNFSPPQGKETYFYALPHTNLKFQNYEKYFLVPLSYFLQEEVPVRKGVLVYASGVKDESMGYLIDWVIENFPNEKICIVGKKILKTSVLSFENLTYFSYYNLMLESEYFLSYFGQSLLEALHLGCKCMSFSISTYHTELSKFLESQIKIPFLGEISQKNLQLKTSPSTLNKKEIPLGFETLLQLILKSI